MAPLAPSGTRKKQATFTYDKSFQLKLLRVLHQDPDWTCNTGILLTGDEFEGRLRKWLGKTMLDYARREGHCISEDALRIILKRDQKPRHQRNRRTGQLITDHTGKPKVLPPRLNEEDEPELHALINGLSKPVQDRSFVKEELYRFIKKRTVDDAILEMLDYRDAGDYEGVDRCVTRILDVQQADDGGFGHFHVRDRHQRTERRRNYVKNGIATGLKVDDHLKPGGLPKGRVGVLLAATNGGKTQTLVTFGKAAIVESNAKVLHITLEDSEEYVQDLYDSAFTGVQISGLEAKWQKVEREIEDLGQQFGESLVIKEFPGAWLTASRLKAYVRRLEHKGFYPDLVIIDYIDECEPDLASSFEKNHERQARAIQEFTAVINTQTGLNVALWTAVQGDRASLSAEEIDLDNMGGSIKRAQKAAVVLAICQTEEEEKAGLGRIVLAKNKLGPKKLVFRCRFDRSRVSVRCL